MLHLRLSFGLLTIGFLASAAGCNRPAPTPTPPPAAPAAAPMAPPAQAEAPMPPAPPAPPADPAKAIPNVPAKLVDKNKALAENPKLVDTENKVIIGDPVSFAGSVYFSAINQVTYASLKQTIDAHKALNDKPPTYDELMAMLKMVNFEFPGLKPWQVYAYDDKDGTVTVLEDPDAKAEAFKKVGL